ncbi:MAG: DUF262 domain-containing protein [Formosimonas sp.]
MSVLNNQINFKQLLDRHGSVCIPIIQRDYAQGREEEKEVRKDFLQAILAALVKPEGDPSLPFNLDFIYGTVEEEKRFLPLDGQQRLTTLFLLHWYLAWKDGKSEDFVKIFSDSDKGKSRFYYRVRPSSNEFFDALVNFRPGKAPAEDNKPSDLIVDQPWYFRSWRLDTTIQSALIMLDDIHGLFCDSTNLFERLISDSQPAITFQLLDLQNFGLSNDLYIKMNSRGKPLTPFETFKARYEHELKVQEAEFADISYEHGGITRNVAKYVAWRMDNAWVDLFWAARDEASNQYDGAMMSVFRAVALVTRDPDSDTYLDDVKSLRNVESAPNYSEFHDGKWLDKGFTLSVIALLDAWSGDSEGLQAQLPKGHPFKERDLFQKIADPKKALSYTEAVQFAAYVLFLESHKDGYNVEHLKDWMRIVFNLAENTDYNRPDDFKRSINGLRELLHASKDILGYLAVPENSAVGFSVQQIEEEKLKARLVRSGCDWGEIIDTAEAHGYFRGQIGFLLNYCGIQADAPIQDWSEEQHREVQGKFQEYFAKASMMFDEKGLSPEPNFLWERALLCVDDYLLPSGRNYSFLVNTSTEEGSWKRLLRGRDCAFECREHLKDLLDNIDPDPAAVDIETQLSAFIEEATGLDPWIEALVHTPKALAYCQSRCLRFDEDTDQIYLLSKTQMNGMHAELFSYALYCKLLDDEAKLAPLQLDEDDYIFSSETVTEPSFYIRFTINEVELHLDVTFDGKKFKVEFEKDSEVVLKEGVSDVLRDLDLLDKDEESISHEIDRGKIESWLLVLAASVASKQA